MGGGDPKVTGGGGVKTWTGSGAQEGTTTTVRTGDANLGDVAKRLGISESELRAANPKLKEPIQAGQELNVPEKKSSDAPTDPAHFGGPNDPPEKDSTPQKAELAMEGRLMEVALRGQIKAFTGFGTDEAAIAREIIGKQLADAAKKDPATAGPKIQERLATTGSDSDDYAATIMKNFTDEDLKKLASTKEGLAILEQLQTQMMDGNVEAPHQVQLDRITTVYHSAPLDPSERAKALSGQAYSQSPPKLEWLGNKLADLVKKDPANGAKTADAVLRRALSGDRDQIAVAMTKNFSAAELQQFGSTPDGKKLTDRLKNELTTGYPTIEKQTQAARIEVFVDLPRNPAFNTLSDTTKGHVKAALQRNEANPTMMRNLASLATTPGFEKLSETARKELLDIMEKKGSDAGFATLVKHLAGSAEFQSLGDTARATVLQSLTKFTGTESYKKMSGTDQVKSLFIIGNLSLHSASNPSNVVARNTLNHLVNGTKKIELYEDKNTGVGGWAGANGTIHINVGHPGQVASTTGLDPANRNSLVEALAHEMNHDLNGRTAPGTPDRFLDEYRAYFVGKMGVGQNPPTVASMRRVLELLAGTSAEGTPYDHIRKVYRENAEFRKIVDEVRNDLNATPPKITTPEQLRIKMKDLPRTDFSEPGGGAADPRSLYLNTSGNDDNH